MPQPKQRLDALTTLRFFAAALIVIGHSNPLFGPFAFVRAIPFNQGVSFFFLLSGFILTWNYPALNNWAERRHFWLARFARVWPLHFVTLLVCVAVIFNFDRSGNFPGVEGFAQLLANLLLLQAWVPVHSWALSFNDVAWSISVELFFYLMFPLLIILWTKHWHKILFIQIVFISTIIILTTVYTVPFESTATKVTVPVLLYLAPAVRIFEFSIGIALAFVIQRIMLTNFKLSQVQWLFLELAAIFIITISMLAAANLAGIRQTLGHPATFYFEASGLWLFWSFLIGIFALSCGPITKALSLRPAVFLGEISFALYLCHALLIRYLGSYRELVQTYGMFGYAVFWIWCLLFATLLFTGIETPFRKLVLAVAAKKASVKHAYVIVRVCFGFKEIFAIAALASMSSAMVFLRPSTIMALDDVKVMQFMQPSSELIGLSGVVTFNNKYEILELRVRAPGTDKNTAEILVLMRVKETLHATDILALHTVASDGQLTSVFDRRLDSGRLDIRAGTRWIQKFVVPKATLDQSASLGLAMYATPAKLFDAVGGNRDWGGRRLIVPIQH